MIIDGGSFSDARGEIKFVNDFDFKGIKRFYQIQNYKKFYIRAWHGHKFETKYFYVSQGAILLGKVNLESNEVEKFVLTASQPKIIKIPNNHANGFMNLTSNTNIIVFSDKTLDESKGDDIRFPYDKWNIWNIENY